MIIHFDRTIIRLLAAGLWLVAAGSTLAAEPILDLYWHSNSGIKTLWAVPKTKSPADPAVMYRSLDAGQTWEVTAPLPSALGEPPQITAAVSVHTGLGYSQLFVATGAEGVYRSGNEGLSWEKWNDADVGIVAMQGANHVGVASVITSDGATFRTTNSGNDWTQIYNLPLTVSALAQVYSTTYAGTTGGEIFAVPSDESFIENLTSGNGALSGAVKALIDGDGDLFAVVENPNGSKRLYRRGPFSQGRWDDVLVNGATANVIAIATGYRYLVIIIASPEPALLISTDGGDTWETATLPVADGINSLAVQPCAISNCRPAILLATDTGGYKRDENDTAWHALADIVSAGQHSDSTATSDLRIRMVSPLPSTTVIARTLTRYELSVTTLGQEDVYEIVANVQFTQWRTGSAYGVEIYVTGGVTIDGQDCRRGTDVRGFKIYICELSALAAGDSASIVVTHSLPADATFVQIDAKVESDRLNDTDPTNDNVYFSPTVGDNTELSSDYAGEGGGGGATGIWTLLGLLVLGRIRNRNHCMIE